jgi:hypothetical protein
VISNSRQSSNNNVQVHFLQHRIIRRKLKTKGGEKDVEQIWQSLL